MRLFFLFITFYLPTILSAQFNMADYMSQNTTFTQEAFLTNFPYKTYLKDIAFTDFKTLEMHRDSLNADTLRPLESVEPNSLIALAVFFGQTRLIDNIRLP